MLAFKGETILKKFTFPITDFPLFALVIYFLLKSNIIIMFDKIPRINFFTVTEFNSESVNHDST